MKNETARKQQAQHTPDALQACAGTVWRTHSWRSTPCHKSAVKFEDGKWWCGTHAPSTEAKRRAKSDAKLKEDYARKQSGYAKLREQQRLAEAYPALLASHAALVEAINAYAPFLALHQDSWPSKWQSLQSALAQTKQVTK